MNARRERCKQHYGNARSDVGSRINWHGVRYLVWKHTATDNGYIYTVTRRRGTATYTIVHNGSYMYAPQRVW